MRILKESSFPFFIGGVIIFLFPIFSQAQNLDSIYKVYVQSDSLTKLEILDELIKVDQYYEVVQEADIEEAIQVAKNLHSEKWEGIYFNRLGSFNTYYSEFEAAVGCFKKAASILKNTTEKEELFFSIYQIADNAAAIQDYPTTLQYTQKAEALAREWQDSAFTVQTNYLWAIFYYDLNNYEKALEFAQKATVVPWAERDFLPPVYNLIGNCFHDMNLADSAYFYYSQAISSLQHNEEQRSYYQPVINGNIGDYLMEKNLYPAAEKVILSGLELADKEDLYSQIFLKLKLGKVYLATGGLTKLDQLLKKIKDPVIELNDFDIITGYYKLLRNLNRKLDNHQLAWQADMLYENYMDSIYDADKEIQMLGLKAAYDFEQKNREIKSLQKENQLNGIIQVISLGIIFLLVISFYLFYERFKLKSKNQQQRIQQKNLELEHLGNLEKLRLSEQKRIQEKMEIMSRSLLANTTFLIQQKELYRQIQKQIDGLVLVVPADLKKNVIEISKNINQSYQMDKDWEDFKKHFVEIHPDFFDILSKKYELNHNDMRLCAYIKMKLSNKEIAKLLHINAPSVNTARYRLRKKMKLEKEEDLNQFLEELG